MTAFQRYVLCGQLKALLTDLNDGKPIKDDEVTHLMPSRGRVQQPLTRTAEPSFQLVECLFLAFFQAY